MDHFLELDDLETLSSEDNEFLNVTSALSNRNALEKGQASKVFQQARGMFVPIVQSGIVHSGGVVPIRCICGAGEKFRDSKNRSPETPHKKGKDKLTGYETPPKSFSRKRKRFAKKDLDYIYPGKEPIHPKKKVKKNHKSSDKGALLAFLKTFDTKEMTAHQIRSYLQSKGYSTPTRFSEFMQKNDIPYLIVSHKYPKLLSFLQNTRGLSNMTIHEIRGMLQDAGIHCHKSNHSLIRFMNLRGFNYKNVQKKLK